VAATLGAGSMMTVLVEVEVWRVWSVAA